MIGAISVLLAHRPLAQIRAERINLVKAFTDVPKLQAFAKANGLTDEKGEVLFLSMPVPGFMEKLGNYQVLGVFGIHFNADARDAGFYASLPQLAGIRDFVCKNG